jgi:hypothetical protein
VLRHPPAGAAHGWSLPVYRAREGRTMEVVERLERLGRLGRLGRE